MIWQRLRYFHKGEKWGNPDKMNGTLLLLLDEIHYIMNMMHGDVPAIIHCGYDTDGHTPQSQHYMGNAVDLHFKHPMAYKHQITELLNILDKLQVSEHVGLGIYPEWNNPGFHLDVRGTKARWGYMSEYVGYNKIIAMCDLDKEWAYR